MPFHLAEAPSFSHTRINLCTGIFPFVAQPSLWESLFCSVQLGIAANSLSMAAKVGLVIPRWEGLLHVAPAKLHTAFTSQEMDGADGTTSDFSLEGILFLLALPELRFGCVHDTA